MSHDECGERSSSGEICVITDYEIRSTCMIISEWDASISIVCIVRDHAHNVMKFDDLNVARQRLRSFWFSRGPNFCKVIQTAINRTTKKRGGYELPARSNNCTQVIALGRVGHQDRGTANYRIERWTRSERHFDSMNYLKNRVKSKIRRSRPSPGHTMGLGCR